MPAIEWIPFEPGHPLPPRHRLVLVAAIGSSGVAPSVMVGYLKFAAGDPTCPYFVRPGGASGSFATHWADVLGDDFRSPHWKMGQPTGRLRG